MRIPTLKPPKSAGRARALGAGPVVLVQPFRPPVLVWRRATGGY